MSFWFTPIGIILPIVLQPLLIAVYRFFIIKKPLPVKNAKRERLERENIEEDGR